MVQLKDKLQELGESTAGKKAELISRLLEANNKSEQDDTVGEQPVAETEGDEPAVVEPSAVADNAESAVEPDTSATTTAAQTPEERKAARVVRNR